MRCRSCGCTTGLAAPRGEGCPGPLGAGGVCKCHIARDLWPDPMEIRAPDGPTIYDLVAERDQLRARVALLAADRSRLRARVTELEAIIASTPPRRWYAPGW